MNGSMKIRKCNHSIALAVEGKSKCHIFSNDKRRFKMTYKDSDNTKHEEVTFSMVLGWLAAAATAIASVAGIVSFS